MSLKEAAISGMIWSAIDKLGTKVIQFIIGILIARILLPSDYGIIGILAVFVSLSETILDSGFANALIQKQDRTEIDFSTAFFFNVIVGFILYLIIFYFSPYIANFYNIPIITYVARIYSINIIINSLTIVQTAKLAININFKSQSKISLISVLISGLIGLYLAYNNFGVWALVIQGVSASFLRMVFLWIFVKWSPLITFSINSFRNLFSFGSKILCTGLINSIYNHMHSIVIGKVFSPNEVGFFNRGGQFPNLPTDMLTSIVMTVNYPILAKLQNNDDALRIAYKKILTIPLFILYPVLILLIIMAKPLIMAILGEKWLPCIPFIQILSFGAMWNPLTTINLNLLYVKGRTDLVLKLELIKKPIAFIILFSMIPLGIYWLCIGKAIYNLIAFAFNCYYTKKYINLGFWEQMKCILPIIGYCSIMALPMYLFCQINMSSEYKLIIGMLIGYISYILIALFAKDSSLKELYTLIDSYIKNKLCKQ